MRELETVLGLFVEDRVGGRGIYYVAFLYRYTLYF